MVVKRNRSEYSGAWDTDDRSDAEQLARDVGIAGPSGTYAEAWSTEEKQALSDIAEKAGVAGSKGKYAGCISRKDGTVVIDPKCLRDAAEDSGLAGDYFSEWA